MRKRWLLAMLWLPVFCACRKSYLHTVGYVVHSSSKATITYANQKGKLVTVLADTVWYTDFPCDNDGMLLRLKVTDSAGGPILGQIWIDANVAKQQEASGAIDLSAPVPEK